MTEPVCAQLFPYEIEVEAGKEYCWCACGRSSHQPFCDGSHSGTDFQPVAYTADTSKTVFFCGCKASKTPPICDGSHSKL